VALGGFATDSVVHSCGSGITACHNLFAMERAGLGPTRLYPGSWSEWIRDPARPLETGKAP
jgi:thiosulfate/3-mercaptopyruvate sulfurtransferase